jgi:hypothetical protein
VVPRAGLDGCGVRSASSTLFRPPRDQKRLYRLEQRKRMFFKWLVLGKGGVDDVGREPADSSDSAVSVAMGHWNVEHCVFVV